MDRVVEVKFSKEARQTYCFKIKPDIEVEVNSLVCVFTKNGFSLARVVREVPNEEEFFELLLKATQWVVAVIDLTEHLYRSKRATNRKLAIKLLKEKQVEQEELASLKLLKGLDSETDKLIEVATNE